MDIWSSLIWLANTQETIPGVAGNLTVLDGHGKLLDSGKKPADFGSAQAVETLYKLTKGQVWDAQTNSTAAYAKTVPSGAVSAEIVTIGGKTVVWNMQSKNDRPSGTNNGVTYTNTNGVWRISGSVDGVSSFYILDAVDSRGSAIAGHVYLVYNNSGVSAYLYMNASKSGMNDTLVESGAVLYTVPAERDGQSVAMGFRLEAGESADNSGRAWFLDLTQMFGSDVPTSISDPRIPEIIAYANAHPGYDTGTLLHAAVTSVVSKDGGAATVGTLEIPAAVRALEGYGQSAFNGSGNTLNLADGTYTEIGHYVGSTWTLLATPNVTDVSSLLPDNMLDVEAGGTLSFESEARLAAPSRVDYLIKLSEVTP